MGGVKCPDKCGPIGKEWRKLEEIKQRTAMNAMRKRQELVKDAKTLREGVQLSITQLEGEIRNLEAKKEELEKTYKDVERREKGKVVGSKGKGSKVTILAGLAKDRVEVLRDALVNIAEKRDELRNRVDQLEAILTTFKEEYNPNFNDEGVKRAVKAWEDYATGKAVEDQAAEDALDQQIEDITEPDSETQGINWAEWETEQESDTDASEYRLLEVLCLTKSLMPLQSTSLRSTFRASSVNGSTPRSQTSASCSWRTASWLTTPTLSPKL